MVFENYNLKSYIEMNGYHVRDKSHILDKQLTLCGINNNQLIQYKKILNQKTICLGNYTKSIPFESLVVIAS
jgi:hypothetical protein